MSTKNFDHDEPDAATAYLRDKTRGIESESDAVDRLVNLVKRNEGKPKADVKRDIVEFLREGNLG